MDFKEVLEVVEQLNNTMYEQLNEKYPEIDIDDEWYRFEVLLVSNGHVHSIKFLDIILWCSENDERDYEDDGLNGVYEPLFGFVWYEMKKIFNDLTLLSKIMEKN